MKKHKSAKKSIVNSDFESREILKSTLDASDQIIFVKNSKGVYILANTAFSVKFRRPLSKIVGMTDKDIFTEKDARKLIEIDRSIIKSGRRNTREDVLVIDGKERIFRATKVPIWSTEGKIVGLCGFAEEITEQKRTQLLQDITYKITNAAVQHNSLTKLYRIIHNELNRLLNADNFYISLYDRENDLITFPYYVDENAPGRDPASTTSRKRRKGLTEYVMKSGKAVVLDQKKIKELLKKGKIKKFGTFPQIWLGAPLKSNKKVFGVIAVQSYKDSETYTKEDLELFKFISDQISIAMEQTQSNALLQNSEANYRALADRSIQGILIVQDYRIVYANKAFAQISGYSIKELLSLPSRGIKNLVHPDDQKFVWDNWQKRLSGEKVPPHYEYRGVKKDGKVVWLEMFASRVMHDEKPAVQGSIIETTKRKKTEEALRESEQKYRSLIENSPDGIFIASKSGNFLSVNKAISEKLGYSEKEITSMNFEDIMTKEYREFFRKRIVRILKGETSAEPGEYKIKAKNGKEYIVEVSSVPCIREGKNIGFQGLVRDITRRRKLKEELLRIQKLESLGTLAGGIAHDFNNILTGILAGVSIVKMQMDPQSKMYDVLKDTEKACMRASELTQQLLTFSKGGIPIKEFLNVKQLIEDSAKFALRGSKHECKVSIPTDLWTVNADKGQMSQVIQNLVINASQATPESGVIVVKAENVYIDNKSSLPLKEGKYIKVSVEDYGIGISSEHINKIFDPYFTTKQKGSGLGLSVCYSIIKNHNGYISANSELDVGATFTFYLPAVGETTPESDTEKEGVIYGEGRILVMDDEEMVRNAVGMMLKNLGYEVEFAFDGAEAVEKYHNANEQGQPFDVVIMDLVIPGRMGGKDAIKELLKIDSNVKAIVSSGYSTDPVMSNYSEYGFSAVAVKPFNLNTLSKIVRSLITKKKDKNQGNLF